MKEAILLGGVPTGEGQTKLPLYATETGTWAFMTTFLGAYHYLQFPAIQGEQIVVPMNLNINHSYTFKLYMPDNSLFNDTSYNLVAIQQTKTA